MNKVRLEGTRHAQFAGAWYPGSFDSLLQAVDAYLDRATGDVVPGEVVGLIAPHAGYMYSGQVAAHAYRQLREKKADYDTVVVIGPSHRYALEGYGITAVERFETPLGPVSLDREVLNDLGSHIHMLMYLSADEEHSLEIQLPFLQRALASFKLVPIMMGEPSLEVCQELGEALGAVLRGRRALVVASSDLSHYRDYDETVALDRQIVEQVSTFDAMGLSQLLSEGKAEACGGGPMVATMLAAKALGADQSAVLKYANSGDVSGNRGNVVGYLAAAFSRPTEGAD